LPEDRYQTPADLAAALLPFAGFEQEPTVVRLWPRAACGAEPSASTVGPAGQRADTMRPEKAPPPQGPGAGLPSAGTAGGGPAGWPKTDTFRPAPGLQSWSSPGAPSEAEAPPRRRGKRLLVALLLALLLPLGGVAAFWMLRTHGFRDDDPGDGKDEVVDNRPPAGKDQDPAKDPPQKKDPPPKKDGDANQAGREQPEDIPPPTPDDQPVVERLPDARLPDEGFPAEFASFSANGDRLLLGAGATLRVYDLSGGGTTLKWRSTLPFTYRDPDYKDPKTMVRPPMRATLSA